MKRITFIASIFFTLHVYAIDKFDVAVCEAQPDDESRINCFKGLKLSGKSCKATSTVRELECYRKLANQSTNLKSSVSENKLSGSYYVTSETLDVRLAPDNDSRITNTLYERQKVDVLEVNNEWGRISKYYNGSVEGMNGMVARWVLMEDLDSKPIKIQPLTNQKTSRVELAIRSSDNFSNYRQVFIDASQRLINEGKCTLADFQEMGGWMRSSNHKPKPVFFTYCGGIRKSNRIYLNAKSGAIFN